MAKGFVPEGSAEGWQLSTPSPMLYASHKAALEIFAEASPATVFEENQKLNDYLRWLLNEAVRDVPAGSLTVFTPGSRGEKGCQVSLAVKNGKKVFEALSQQGVFADWREPDVIRVAPVSLYNTYAEVFLFSKILKEAILTFAA